MIWKSHNVATMQPSPSRVPPRRRLTSVAAVVNEWICVGLASAIVLLAGCKDQNLDKRAEVSGAVTLDGQPVQKAAITFFPTGGTSGPTAGGTVVNGMYHISQAEGPVIGDNRVEFNGSKTTGKKIKDRYGDDITQEETVPLFPEKYSMRSKLQVTVKPGHNENLDFHLNTKKN